MRSTKRQIRLWQRWLEQECKEPGQQAAGSVQEDTGREKRYLSNLREDSKKQSDLDLIVFIFEFRRILTELDQGLYHEFAEENGGCQTSCFEQQEDSDHCEVGTL